MALVVHFLFNLLFHYLFCIR